MIKYGYMFRKDKLREFLASYGVNFKKWGTGAAKNFDDLFNEVKAGESVIKEDENGNLMREVTVVCANITYYDGETGTEYHLIEEKQVFADGRKRKRNLNCSMAGKIKQGENIKDSLKREIFEELGISGALNINYKDKAEKIEESLSYPGLKTKYTEHYFLVKLTKEQFSRKGYMEYEPNTGIKTYFVWKRKPLAFSYFSGII